MAEMSFQQAQIPVQKAEDFEHLKAAVERVFGSTALEKLYRRLESKDIRAREFEKIVSSGLLELVDSTLARSGRTAKERFEALTVSDRALIREYYLEKIEQVDPKLRQKFNKVYRYY